MDRKKRRWLIGGTSAAVLTGLVFYASAEPEVEPKQRAKSVEEERIEGLVDLMTTDSAGEIESTAMRLPPPVNVPMPEGEAFDVGAAVTSHRRAAEAADAIDYYDCDGDCTGQGVGIMMDGTAAPVPGDEIGGFDPTPQRRAAPSPSPQNQATGAMGTDPRL